MHNTPAEKVGFTYRREVQNKSDRKIEKNPKFWVKMFSPQKLPHGVYIVGRSTLVPNS